MSFTFRHLPTTSQVDTTANFEQLQAELNEPWEPLTLTAKLEANAVLQAPGVRLEQNGTVARLRGGPKVKAGQELKALEVIATLAVNKRPQTVIAIGLAYPAANAALQLTIAENGTLSLSGNIIAGNTFFLDGVTFNLT